MVKVSVIIPAYNAERYIREAIDSVLNQTFKDFEIIVIDDGSTDNTSKILESYGNKIRWKSQENKGQASAQNEGIKIAKGDYLAYLDADDIYFPKILETQVKYLDKHSDAGLVYSDYYQIDDKKILKIAKSQPFDYLLLLQNNYICKSTVMHRRECLVCANLFDESINGRDDWDMWVRISEKFKAGYINKPLVKYRVHEDSWTHSLPNEQDNLRYCHIKIIKKTYKRRGKPFWLKIQIIRTMVIGKVTLEIMKIKEMLGKVHPVCRKFGSVVLIAWNVVDSTLFYIENFFYRHS